MKLLPWQFGLVYSIFGIMIMVFMNHPVKAFNMEDHIFSSEKYSTGMSSKERIKKEHDLNFGLDLKSLSKGSLHMVVKEFEKKNLGQLKFWDIKNIHRNKYLGDGYFTLGKSAYLFKDRTPDFFSKDRALSKSYLKKTQQGSSIVSIEKDKDEITFQTKIKILFIKIKTVSTIIHIEEYDHLEDFLKSLGEEFQSTWEELGTEIDLPLEKITVTYSNRDDISPKMLSVGGSTVNFYYNVDDRHTLHVSYKIISFCKVPKFAKSTILEEQYTRTWENLRSVDKYREE